jgi:hypothetical protein
MIKARKQAARSKSSKPRLTDPKPQRKLAPRERKGQLPAESGALDELGKRAGAESSTESEQPTGAKTGYQARLRTRQPLRKFSYDAAADSDDGDSDNHGYLGKRRKGKKIKNKVAGRIPVNCAHPETE